MRRYIYYSIHSLSYKYLFRLLSNGSSNSFVSIWLLRGKYGNFDLIFKLSAPKWSAKILFLDKIWYWISHLFRIIRLKINIPLSDFQMCAHFCLVLTNFSKNSTLDDFGQTFSQYPSWNDVNLSIIATCYSHLALSFSLQCFRVNLPLN